MAKRNEILQTFLEAAAVQLTNVDSSDDEAENQIWDELEDNSCVFSGLRYSYRGNVPKTYNWFDDVLPNLDEKRFKSMLRVSREQFNVILGVIENHPVFRGVNSEKQFTTQFQLSLVLYRLGSSGDGATLAKIAGLFGIGDGGTIAKITNRVFESILSLGNDFINWPRETERDEIVVDTFHELPNCIGYVDGTEIPLQERPILDHESYYSKDKVYSVKLQATCDYSLRIRQITVGYPGSVHDARVYNNCKLATNPSNFFSDSQYLAADSAYRLRTTVMTPFKRHATDVTPSEKSKFNKYFSSFRVRIEHVFGILKEIFPSLKCLNIRIKDEKSHKFVCRWIHVCCILYNVLRPHFTNEDLNVNLNSSQRENKKNEEEYEDDEVHDMAKCKRIALARILAQK